MALNKEQVALIAQTLADVAKLLFASSVIGFFVPGSSGAVTLATFLTGFVFATVFFWSSVAMLKS